MLHKYLLQRQGKDERDYKLADLIKPYEGIVLPVHAETSTSPYMPDVFDQLNIGSCGANALVGYKMYDDKNPKLLLSRADAYYNARKVMRTVKQDSGVDNRKMLDGNKKYGICEEEYFRYDVNTFEDDPTPQAVANGLLHKLNSYHAIDESSVPSVFMGIRQTISVLGKPVLMGMDVYKYMESEEMSVKGILKCPKSLETPIGGHDVLLVDYDDKMKFFKVRNSWGKGWGLAGYFLMPYAYIEKKYAWDFWAVS